MKKSICIYFQVHQPMRFKSFRFFDIGKSDYYFDDYLNEADINRAAQNSYLPTNEMLLKLIKQNGDNIKVAFSITGIALELFELHAPEVIMSFKKLAATGSVDFLAETYSNSLSVFKDEEGFKSQVKSHHAKIKKLFRVEPTVFRNTDLIYSNRIGELVESMGYKVMLTEGAKHILGGQSPNFIYHAHQLPSLKLLLRNYGLSDDIAIRASDKNWQEYPVTAKKLLDWSYESLISGENLNLFMNYEAFGLYQNPNNELLDLFAKYIKEIVKSKDLELLTPAMVAEKYIARSELSVPNPISWANEERDLSAWFGNDLQEDAYNRLYSVSEKIKKCSNKKLLNNWKFLQASEHLNYMCNKIYNHVSISNARYPFNNIYDAYINYMNILSDFIIRVNAEVPESKKDRELATLASIIYDKNLEIEKYEKELKNLKNKLQDKEKTQRKKQSGSLKSTKK